MKLQLVPPRRGVVWVQQAFRTFVRQPLGFAALFATCLFIVLVLGIVPIVGTIALLVLPPAGSLVFMIASRRVAEGSLAMPGALVDLASSGRARLLPLLKLGVAYAAATVVLFWLARAVDGGALDTFLGSLPDAKSSPEATASRMADPRLQLGVLLRLAFAGALSIPFWHAPALVHWGRQGWAKSLFFSSVAVWRNKGAFSVYALAWAALWMVLLAFVSVGVGLFGPQPFTFVATPLMLVFATVFYASFWFTFADCFSSDDGGRSRDGVRASDSDSLRSST